MDHIEPMRKVSVHNKTEKIDTLSFILKDNKGSKIKLSAFANHGQKISETIRRGEVTCLNCHNRIV